MKLTKQEIELVTYLYDHKILIEFNSHETHILDMSDKFDSPAALEWKPLSKFMDIHFDEDFIWWGDKESSDSMLIHVNTVYKISTPCLGQFSYQTTKLDHNISDFYDLIYKITFEIDENIMYCRCLFNNSPKYSKVHIYDRKRIKLNYKKVVIMINKANKKLNKIYAIIRKGTLLYRYLFEFDRKNINRYLRYIERNLCDVRELQYADKPNKETFNLTSKAYNKYIELIQKFNNGIYLYNKKHNTDLQGIQTIIMSIRIPIFERKNITVPELIFKKINKYGLLVWDDWRADISNKGECSKYICRLIIGAGEKTSAVGFYFVFAKDSQASNESEPYQFKYLIAYRYLPVKWFIKQYSPSELERVTRLVVYNDDPLTALDLKECAGNCNPLNHI